MNTRRVSRRSLIRSEEQALIEALLVMPDAALRKTGLQRMCSLYEVGARLAEAFKISLLLNALMWDKAEEVRRWACKAVALVRNRDANLDALTSRIVDVDPDLENATWAITALFSIVGTDCARAILREKGIALDEPGLLASMLFAANGCGAAEGASRVDIEVAPPLTLKWACLLFGYNKVPENLFHPRLANVKLMGELNGHDEPTVAEYSIWALVQNPDCEISDLGFDPRDIVGMPSNVRRWGCRLITKDSQTLRHYEELARELMIDESVSAREGLALGLKNLFYDGMEALVLDWLPIEPPGPVRDVLLEHMATQSAKIPEYHEIALGSYVEAPYNSVQRSRLESASAGTPLFAEFQRIKQRQSAQPGLFGEPPTLVYAPNLENISMSTQNFNANRDIKLGANVGQGNIYVKAGALINEMPDEYAEARSVLGEILSVIQKAQLPASEKDSVSAIISQAAKNPSPSIFAKLAGHLRGVRDSVQYGTQTGELLAPLIERIQDIQF